MCARGGLPAPVPCYEVVRPYRVEAGLAPALTISNLEGRKIKSFCGTITKMGFVCIGMSSILNPAP